MNNGEIQLFPHTNCLMKSIEKKIDHCFLIKQFKNLNNFVKLIDAEKTITNKRGAIA